jgi:hypothetical protein
MPPNLLFDLDLVRFWLYGGTSKASPSGRGMWNCGRRVVLSGTVAFGRSLVRSMLKLMFWICRNWMLR